MILELPKSDMGEYRFLIKLKMVPSSRPVPFSPVIHSIRFDLPVPTGIGFDAEPRSKSALRHLHAVSGALHVGNGVRRGSGRVSRVVPLPASLHERLP